MPRLEARGSGVVIKDNLDKTVAYFPGAPGYDVTLSPYGDSTDEQRMLAEGLVAQTFPRQVAAATLSPGAGTYRATLIFIRRGTVLTTGWLGIAANGTGVTLAKVGLYRCSDLALVAASGDISALLNAGTLPRMQSAPLTAVYTVPADQAFYAGALQVGGTPANLSAGASQSGPAIGPGFAASHGATAGQSDLPNPLPGSPPGIGGGSIAIWVGFS